MTNSTLYLLLVIVTVTIPHAVTETFCPLKFKDCGSKAGKLTGVSFNETCTGGKAILKKGTVVKIDFSFSSKNDESQLTSEVYGKIGVLPFVSFPLGNPDACKDSGLTCPIKANTKQEYKPILSVLSEYPSVNVIVKWELKNKDKQDVFCALIPAVITA